MKQRKKRSKVWFIETEKLKEIVKNQKSLAGILKEIGVVFGGGGVFALKKRLVQENIDYSHIPLGLQHNKGIPSGIKKKDLSEILVYNSNYTRSKLKKRLIKENILKEECATCGLGPVWNNKPISLQLDHINGIYNDNRLKNLRILCPNCHTQTDTWCNKAGRYKKERGILIKRKPLKRKCSRCKVEISDKSKNQLCTPCFSEIRQKTVRPIKEILLKKIQEQGYSATAREYGVSDNAIRKWSKQ